MATKVEIDGWLSKLQGEHSIDTIVNKIKTLSLLKSENSKVLLSQEDPYKGEPTVKLSGLKVDMSYQRTLNLDKILEHLKRSNNQFDRFLAGHIDVCTRPDGDTFVWDGFRRTILAGLKGLPGLPASEVDHDNLSRSECRKLEASKFEIKNAYGESMKAEEIWKSRLVQGNPDAVMIANFLDDANLDVLNVMGQGFHMSSFSEVEKVLMNHRIPKKYIIEASMMIQKAWENTQSVKGYLMLGIAQLLEYIDDVKRDDDDEYNGDGDKFVSSFNNFQENLTTHAKNGIQLNLQNPRLNGNVYGSIAYNVATKVCGLERDDFILVKHCNVEDMLLTIPSSSV
jgi:hypothetical protein